MLRDLASAGREEGERGRQKKHNRKGENLKINRPRPERGKTSEGRQISGGDYLSDEKGGTA